MKVADVKLTKPFSRGPKHLRVLSSVTGFDTETLQTGDVFLACDSDGNHAWIRKVADLFPFILSGKYYVCYNLSFDAPAILKRFGEDFCRELVESDGKQITYGDIGVWYIPGKFLHFRKGNDFTIFWDVAQFFQEQGHYVPLKKAAQVVGMEKKEFDVVKMDGSFYGNQRLLEYCINDAKIAGALGDLVIKEYNDMGIKVSSLASPASIAESYILDQTRTWIPDVTTIPIEVLQYAEDAVIPPWREFFKKGYFGTMYDYDIRSAYPSKVSGLIDITSGDWVKVKRNVPREVTHGYIKCIVDIPKSYLSWVNYRNAFSDNFAPYGKFSVVLTLKGLKNLPKGTQVEILDGWYFTPWEIRYVYRDVLRHLFRLKEKSDEGSLRRHLSKVLSSSLHGKFRQVYNNRFDGGEEAGRMFMPPYEAEVTTNVRLQVYTLAKQLPPDVLIGIHTDCLYSAEKLDMPISNRAGKWDLRGTYPFLVIGLDHFERGKGWFTNGIEKEPKATIYPAPYYPRNVPLSLSGAVNSNRFSDACVFGSVKKEVDVTKQVFKRFWPEVPTSGEALLNNIYDSEMLPVELVTLEVDGD